MLYFAKSAMNGIRWFAEDAWDDKIDLIVVLSGNTEILSWSAGHSMP